LFLNEEGSIKATNCLTWPSSDGKIDKTLQDPPVYLAPEEMSTMQELPQQAGQEAPTEMFCLGLTMLSAANLADYASLYNMEKRTFDEERFMEAIVQWSSNNTYSEVLRGVVVNLCSPSSAKRMTAD
jgi:hypothetical protein